MGTFRLGAHYYAYGYLGVRVYVSFHLRTTMLRVRGLCGAFADVWRIGYFLRSFIVSSSGKLPILVSPFALLHLSLDHVFSSVSFYITTPSLSRIYSRARSGSRGLRYERLLRCSIHTPVKFFAARRSVYVPLIFLSRYHYPL